MKSTVVSDSTCRNIGFRDINSSINRTEEEVTISKHPGATSSELHHISQFHIDREKPDNIIFVSGLNDILSQNRRRATVDCEGIANELIEMGKTARGKGVGRVCISGILIPKFRDCQQYVRETNSIIRDQCAVHGFHYIDQDNIGIDDLFDSLHVNHLGNTKLKHNIFSQFYTYNILHWLDLPPEGGSPQEGGLPQEGGITPEGEPPDGGNSTGEINNIQENDLLSNMSTAPVQNNPNPPGGPQL